MMIFRFLSPSIALSFLLLFACGCASDPIPAWQKNLAGYVNNHGHGEISALRGLEDSPGRPGFTVISASSGGLQPLSASRTDVHGLLLGRGNFEGRSWFFFLVGVDNYEGDMTYFPLDKASISDIRLIALSWNNGVPTWR
ncbi:MAG TPA: hypothetical protein VG711_11965, partial [Phycisphaerales bacterium]|nr:hypothetical protein [Phycisphaerales bacterium]